MTGARTFFDKVWDEHVVADLGDGAWLVYIDRNFQHELTGAISLRGLTDAGRTVRRPDLSFGTMDHVLDTFAGRGDRTLVPRGTEFIRAFRAACDRHGIELFDIASAEQGIVHVIAPELGIALPGCTFVCGDSHTCTVGGVGAFAFGIGSTDVEHVFATQTLAVTRPRTMRVELTGRLAAGVYPKDLILHLIGRIGADGGNGYAMEFAGPVLHTLPMEGRLTLCNMAVELSARTGLVAPDQITYEYLHGRPFAPAGRAWDEALAYWRGLPSDPGARYDHDVQMNCDAVTPQVTWGTSPEHVVSVDGVVPDPAAAGSAKMRTGMEKALAYTGLAPGMRITDLAIDAAFIGSCTNSRLSDLRAAARTLRGRKVAPGVQAICSPGSTRVKREAEAEGIDRIFVEAGFQWREAGCSLCCAPGCGGESFRERARLITSTNRNFENRQGRGVVSHLASPATVAWSAVQGRIADIRTAER
ncbi:MAG: 3-isopropylmalate dehydratase large subunit [Gammaproteobacteria bacterium]|nr:3-isopropylmalate dehydratase large subunit [Gammaproteobacteria bacterium]